MPFDYGGGGGGRFVSKIKQPTCELAMAAGVTGERESQHKSQRHRRRRHQQQVNNLATVAANAADAAATSSPVHHHNQRHLSEASGRAPGPATNQLKDGRSQQSLLAPYCCRDYLANVEDGGQRHRYRRHEQSASSILAPVNRYRHDCSNQYDQEDAGDYSDEANHRRHHYNHHHDYYDDEDNDDDHDEAGDHDSGQERGLTAVPVQAKGRLSMSVAEQVS